MVEVNSFLMMVLNLDKITIMMLDKRADAKPSKWGNKVSNSDSVILMICTTVVKLDSSTKIKSK